MVNLRGGSEYGEEWHQAGTKMRKQNVFDDFIAATEWLIAQRYTNSQRVAIQGGSNGGLLVGACMTQRPDLFKVAIPQVGVMDMLRYHLFTIGWNWASDYGTSADSSEMFEYLRERHLLCECKYSAEQMNGNQAAPSTSTDSLNFRSESPKLMTYHSAKGLQFETVILPMFSEAKSKAARKALYVAMTRSYRNLYVMYTGSLGAPLSAVPTHLYVAKE